MGQAPLSGEPESTVRIWRCPLSRARATTAGSFRKREQLALTTAHELQAILSQEVRKDPSQGNRLLQDSLQGYLRVRGVAGDVLQYPVPAGDIETPKIGPMPGAVRLAAAQGCDDLGLARPVVGQFDLDAVVAVDDAVFGSNWSGQTREVRNVICSAPSVRTTSRQSRRFGTGPG